MALSGMLAQMMQQSAESPTMSENQRALINTAGRGFGAAAGAYTQPDLTTSKGALAAALQAQDYGDMAGFKTYTDLAAKLQSEEGATGRTKMTIEAQAAEGAADRALRRDEGSDNRALEKYGIDARLATQKDIAFADRASAMERLKYEVNSKEGMQSEQLTARMKELDKELDARWKEMNEEEKGRMARAKLEARAQLKAVRLREQGENSRAAAKNLIPKKDDLEAMMILAQNHPDAAVREAAIGEEGFLGSSLGEKEAMAGPMASSYFTAIMAGADPNKALVAFSNGYTFDPAQGIFVPLPKEE